MGIPAEAVFACRRTGGRLSERSFAASGIPPDQKRPSGRQRRMGAGKKIIIEDKSLENAKRAAKIMNEAGFDVEAVEMDLSSKESILGLIQKAASYGEITMLINAAGVSPSQVTVETILNVDLYGTAVLLEEIGKVIAPGGAGVTISSQSGHRMKQLTPEEDELLAVTPAQELLMSEKGAFITGTDFLVDGGATASYFYDPLKPEEA